MSSRRNKYLLYALVFFHNLIPAYTIERLFWQERGMNVKMVVWCEIVYAAIIVCMEFPSGLLADRYGRKKLIIASTILCFIEMAVITFAVSFWNFMLAIFFAGLGESFASGAYNALLYDSLNSDGCSDEFEKILGKINAIDFSAAILAALSGGFLAAKYGMLFNYYLSVASCGVTIVVSLLLIEPVRTSPSDESQTLLSIVKSALSFFKSHTTAMKILLNAVFISASISYIYEFWQLYLEKIAFPVALFGVVSATLSIMVIPASLISSKLLKFFKHEQVILLFSILCGIGILFAAAMKSVNGIIGLAFACAGNAVISPVAFSYLHRKADDNARATIESVVSLGERLISIMLGLLFGHISTFFGINAGFMALGLLIILASICFVSAYSFKRAM